MELCSMLCANLDGRGEWGAKGSLRLAEWLLCPQRIFLLPSHVGDPAPCTHG